MVQFDADRLKCPFCRMSAFRPDLCRDRAADDLCELQCRLDWVDLPLSDDVLRDILCETILAVIADNSIQLHLAVGINDMGGRSGRDGRFFYFHLLANWKKRLPLYAQYR